MFKDELQICSLTNNVARELIDNIYGDPVGSDESFIAVLRALLYPRLQKNEKFNFYYLRVNSDYPDDYKATMDLNEPYSIRLVNIYATMKNVKEKIEEVQSAWESKAKEDWEELVNIRKFCEDWLSLHVYINRKTNSAKIYVMNMDMRHLHFIESLTSKYVPELFKEKPITEKEIKLVESATKDSYDDFYKNLDEIGKSFNLEAKWTEMRLDKFKKKTYEAMIAAKKTDFENIQDIIRRTLQSYNDYMKRLDTARNEIFGLETRMNNADDDNMIKDYFKTHKNISLYDTSGDTICIEVYTYLNNFDTDVYEQIKERDPINNYGVNSTLDKNAVKRILNKIFLDETIKIKMCSYYNLSLSGTVDTYDNHQYAKGGYMINPHIKYHECLGDYGPAIIEALRSGNLEEAMDCCIASAGSVNVMESITFKMIPRDLFGTYYNSKILEINGEEFTPKEVYQKELENETDKAE